MSVAKRIQEIGKKLKAEKGMQTGYAVNNEDIATVIRHFYHSGGITFTVIPYTEKEVMLIPYSHPHAVAGGELE